MFSRIILIAMLAGMLNDGLDTPMLLAQSGSCGGILIAKSPLEKVRATVGRAVAVLRDPTYQGAAQRQQRQEKVSAIVLALFDAQEIAKRALGMYWRERTEEQRTEFVRIFTQFVQKTYSSVFDRYTRESLKEVQFFYDQEKVEGDFAQVETRIFDPAQQRNFSVHYRLHKVRGKWLVYDVVIENVSMVKNYRNQFHRILSTSSYEELVQRLQNKLSQLSASAS